MLLEPLAVSMALMTKSIAFLCHSPWQLNWWSQLSCLTLFPSPHQCNTIKNLSPNIKLSFPDSLLAAIYSPRCIERRIRKQYDKLAQACTQTFWNTITLHLNPKDSLSRCFHHVYQPLVTRSYEILSWKCLEFIVDTMIHVHRT